MNFFDEFVLEKELTNSNKGEHIFLLEFLLAAHPFPKGQMIARVLENKLNKEFKLKLLSLIKSSLLKSFQLLKVEEG